MCMELKESVSFLGGDPMLASPPLADRQIASGVFPNAV